MKLSQLTKWPLNVSPFFSSTNYGAADVQSVLVSSARRDGPSCPERRLTIGLFWAAFSSESGNYTIRESQRQS